VTIAGLARERTSAMNPHARPIAGCLGDSDCHTDAKTLGRLSNLRKPGRGGIDPRARKRPPGSPGRRRSIRLQSRISMSCHIPFAPIDGVRASIHPAETSATPKLAIASVKQRRSRHWANSPTSRRSAPPGDSASSSRNGDRLRRHPLRLYRRRASDAIPVFYYYRILESCGCCVPVGLPALGCCRRKHCDARTLCRHWAESTAAHRFETPQCAWRAVSGRLRRASPDPANPRRNIGVRASHRAPPSARLRRHDPLACRAAPASLFSTAPSLRSPPPAIDERTEPALAALAALAKVANRKERFRTHSGEIDRKLPPAADRASRCGSPA